ncbi:MAG: polysaccharide biosynthesis protein [Clostridia bacterium]|nr:polysaccharide biosynthesis protein [Clostridia bacterium]
MDTLKKESLFYNLKSFFLGVADVILINFVSFFTLLVRFEFNLSQLIDSQFLFNIFKFSPLTTLITVIVFIAFKLYRGIWKYAGVDEFITIAAACMCSTAINTVILVILRFTIALNFPKSYPLIYFIFLLGAITSLRFSYRFAGKVKTNIKQSNKLDRVMVIGAGRSGASVLREMQTSPHSRGKVICMLDNDSKKIGKYIHGVKVVNNCEHIPEMAEKYKIDIIILAIPSATNSEKRAIIDECQKTKCTLNIVPSITQLTNGEVRLEQIRNVEIEDLLGRDSIKVDMSEIKEFISEKTVLVTGGGGSIGSELCRQIAKYQPKKLVIFDIYENSAYSIQQELRAKHPELNLDVIIGSVRDIHRVDKLFETYKPDIVYHAAAHKHVPLMEDSPNEAIKNNVFGTYNVANSANKYGVSTFVLISTDKAVNPTNIMGASKRLCEMIIECFAKISETRFVAVRFGNVLGSNGSVIPLFKKQIARGGPVTVTHKDIIRYFMTIPEAVSLVLQAGYYANGGEIFVLDMGQPVKIDDLARRMIKLSGFEPDIDIKIEYTGLRPGEKLYEELLMSEEGLKKTKNDLIFIGKLSDVNADEFFTQLAYLRDECYTDGSNIRKSVKKLVPTYHPENEGVSIV